MQVLTLRCDLPKSVAVLAGVTNREAHPAAIGRISQVKRDAPGLDKFAGLRAVRITKVKTVAGGVEDVLTVRGPGGGVRQNLTHATRRAGGHGQNPDRRLGLRTFCRPSD